MRADMLNSILSDLNGTSAMPADMDEDRIGAMSAAMLSLGERTAQELAYGGLEQVLNNRVTKHGTDRQSLPSRSTGLR